jgi:hypothetical protein
MKRSNLGELVEVVLLVAASRDLRNELWRAIPKAAFTFSV